MKFCPFCGNQVKDVSKFCPSCGSSLIKKAENTINILQQPQQQIDYTAVPTRQAPQPRHISADMTNCPFCGAALSSFSLACPACGSEIRGRKANSACQQMLDKLDEIEANKPRPKQSSGFSKFLSGVSQITDAFDYEDPEDKEMSRINREIERQKEEVIKRFIIPNNKEDILEFLLLAQSNLPCSLDEFIDDPDYYLVEEEDAWAKKYDEAYRKAIIFLKNDPDFKIVNREREKIEEEIAANQEKRRLKEEERQLKKENAISRKLARKIKNSISEKLD